jgi:hypothetical protein
VKAGALFLSGIALVLQLPPAAAVDYGVGVAHEGSGSTVMVPIRTGTLLIEPEILFSNRSATDTSFRLVNPGVGVYAPKELGSLFESYMGGRFAYRTLTNTSGGITSKDTSYALAPTLGIQHFFSKQFSLGLDASLEYRNGKQTRTGQRDQIYNSWNTHTRVLLRAFFF